MRIIRNFVSIGLALAVGCACSSGDAGGGGGGGESLAALCVRDCEKLNCPNEPSDCASQCEANLNTVPERCTTQIRTYLSCTANRPSSDFECAGNGQSIIKASVCATETSALSECMFGGGTGGSGGGGTGGSGGTGGGGDCPFTNDGECDEPELCPPGTDTVDCAA